MRPDFAKLFNFRRYPKSGLLIGLWIGSLDPLLIPNHSSNSNLMKSPLRLSKVRQFFFPIAFLTALLVVISSIAFTQSAVLAKSPNPQDNPACFMETSTGKVIQLDRLCGNTSKGNPSPRSAGFGSSNGNPIAANLEWLKKNPSAPVSNAPSPYDAQRIQNFNRILYGD